MKKLMIMILTLGLVVLMNTGCVGTIYSAVVDERNVKTIANDTSIEFKILKNLTNEKSSDLIDVSVTSYNRDVFLVGEYETNTQKNRFLRATQNVEGVKSVDSYLVMADKMSNCDTKKNLEITARVKAKLIGDKSIWSTNIRVSTIQCQVILWGTVGTEDEITKSIQYSKLVEGVTSVKSFLKSR